MLICFGPLMASLADAVSGPEHKTINTHHCRDADHAVEAVLSVIRDGDGLLVKGSNGMKAHQVAASLKTLSQGTHNHKGDPHAA